MPAGAACRRGCAGATAGQRPGRPPRPCRTANAHGPAAGPGGARPLGMRLRQAASLPRRALQWPHLSWVDIAWVGFVGLNLAAMRLLPAWQTVPFLAIWVSLTVIYGFRLWR